MKIFNAIEIRRVQKHNTLLDARLGGFFGALGIESKKYARLIWLNTCELLTDIIEQVNITIENTAGDGEELFYKANAFKAFAYTWGKVTWQKLFDDGFVVIGYNGIRFWLMGMNEYNQTTDPTDREKTIVMPYDQSIEIYVMRSPTYITQSHSDKALCWSWLEYLDTAMNASSTILSRMGAVVLATPKNTGSAPSAAVLTEDQKKKMEEDLANDYGALRKQHSVLLLPREMNAQVISLANVDIKTEERVRRAVLAIADRIKVPANQIALIDANSSKALSNGNELKEGDKARYKSARRLFERTFVQMGNDLGIRFSYTIDGEPIESAATSDGGTI